jgi:hypothetical protein
MSSTRSIKLTITRSFGYDGVQRLLRVPSERSLDLDLRLFVSGSSSPAGQETYRIMFDLSQSLIARCSNNLHDLNQLIGIVSSPEQWVSSDHLCHTVHQLIIATRENRSSHAPHTPQINTRAISP